MVSEERRPRRPVGGSRHPTSRPRSVAGRRSEPGAPVEPPVETPVEASAGPPVDAPVEAAAEPAQETPSGGAEDQPGQQPAGRPGRTLALVVALVLLVGVAAAEGWYLWLREDPVVSAERPVVIGEVAHRSAVESARTSTEEILSYGFRDFDEQVEQATSLMTPAFAERFRETAGDVEDRFVRDRTEQEVEVVAASVVQASPEKVRALLFLDQYVARDGEGTSVTPYRALVTVVRTDGGWLVDEIETS